LVVFADGDRYFGPVDSPDRRRVAFQGLATGLYVYDLDTGALTHVGAGTAPAWAPDSRRLAFERTTDDGQEIRTSSLWIWKAGAAAQEVFASDDVIARRPAWSPDGRTLAFDDGRGAVYLLAEEAWQ
jgi:Tol biopolymer transport system component